MSEKTLLHLIFVVSFTAFTAIRMYYHRLAYKTAGRVEFKEGRLNALLRLSFGLPYIVLLFVYMFNPRILAWADFQLPVWAQWTGAVLCLSVLPLIYWIQRSLGSNFSTTLHIREEHTLVTFGPYRWVRHPMYTVFFIQAVGILLLTANWFIGGIYLLGLTLVVVSRTRNEEAAMIEKFGNDYQTYMARTGRFLPKF